MYVQLPSWRCIRLSWITHSCRSPGSNVISPFCFCGAGDAEATQQYADLMWRPGSPQGYQPPTLNGPPPGYGTDSHTHRSSRLFVEHGRRNHLQAPSNTELHSSDHTRPGTPPAAGGYPVTSAHAAEPGFGYQPLLEPLLPVSDLLQSSRQHPAQDHQAFRGAPHPPVTRAQSFPTAPPVPALASPVQRPPSHHSHSPQPSEPSQGTLQGLNAPLEPHERQLLNSLLHRSNSTRSQDRFSDHSQSSASTHMDTQPLSLPRSWSARRLTSGSLMLHDTSALQDPHDLSRSAPPHTLNLLSCCLLACLCHHTAKHESLPARDTPDCYSTSLQTDCSSVGQWLSYQATARIKNATQLLNQGCRAANQRLLIKGC